MICPECLSPNHKVIDSRTSESLNSSDNFVRRRRECLDCGLRWTTFETIGSVGKKRLRLGGKYGNEDV